MDENSLWGECVDMVDVKLTSAEKFKNIAKTLEDFDALKDDLRYTDHKNMKCKDWRMRNCSEATSQYGYFNKK